MFAFVGAFSYKSRRGAPRQAAMCGASAPKHRRAKLRQPEESMLRLVWCG